MAARIQRRLYPRREGQRFWRDYRGDRLAVRELQDVPLFHHATARRLTFDCTNGAY